MSNQDAHSETPNSLSPHLIKEKEDECLKLMKLAQAAHFAYLRSSMSLPKHEKVKLEQNLSDSLNKRNECLKWFIENKLPPPVLILKGKELTPAVISQNALLRKYESKSDSELRSILKEVPRRKNYIADNNKLSIHHRKEVIQNLMKEKDEVEEVLNVRREQKVTLLQIGEKPVGIIVDMADKTNDAIQKESSKTGGNITNNDAELRNAQNVILNLQAKNAKLQANIKIKNCPPREALFLIADRNRKGNGKLNYTNIAKELGKDRKTAKTWCNKHGIT